MDAGGGQGPVGRASGLLSFLLVLAVIVGVFVLVDVRFHPGHQGGTVSLEITSTAPDVVPEGWVVRVDNATDLPLELAVVDGGVPVDSEGCLAPAPFVLRAGEVRTWSCPRAARSPGLLEIPLKMQAQSVPGTVFTGDAEWVGVPLAATLPAARPSAAPGTTRDQATVSDTAASFLVVGPMRIVSAVPFALLLVIVGAWVGYLLRWRRRRQALAGAAELRDLAGSASQASWSRYAHRYDG